MLSNRFIMKHLIEVEKLLKDLFFEKWMDDEDWKEFLIELEKASGVTLTSLSNDIEIGVKNGCSLETQIALVKQVLKTV
jgi:hypothetical protein